MREIVKLQLHQLLAKLEEKGYQLIPSEELIEHIGSAGFDPQFGARPVKCLIQKELLNEMSRQIIAGTLEQGVEQVIDVFDGKIPAVAGQAVVRKPVTAKEAEKARVREGEEVRCRLKLWRTKEAQARRSSLTYIRDAMSTESLRNELIAWISKLDDQGLLKALWGFKKLLQGKGSKEPLTNEEREAIASRLGPGAEEADRAFWQQISSAGLERAYGANEPDISGITLLEPNPEYGK